MPQIIRIAIDVEQRTKPGVKITGTFLNEQEKEAPLFLQMEDREAAKQPITIDGGGTRIFTSDGGKLHGEFKWTASDGNERSFTQEIEVPSPPSCPRCERRVPELVDGDYLCEKCRFGN
jgi:hypothetical protein